MLNLSDKELDRFSQEAAQEYEPGEVLGPRSWERLEVRMTQEFGRPGWNPIRHIRRFPFIYAPALLMLLGVGYYLVRPGVSSGSSPGATAAKTAPAQKTAPAEIAAPAQTGTSAQTTTATATQNPANTDKATSTPATSSSATAPQGGGTSAAAAGGANAAPTTPGGVSATPNTPGGASAAPGTPGRVSAISTIPGGAGAAPAAPGVAPAEKGLTRGVMATGKSGGMGSRGDKSKRGSRRTGSGAKNSGAEGTEDDARGSVNGSPLGLTKAPTSAERELSLAYVQRPRSLAKRGVIGDSALRAFNAKTGVAPPIRKKGIYEINRKWQFGLTIAPDFSSVNALAGDKAGSSIGLTVDYLFAPHWYLSTGILATRKNYAARNQDYHAPPGFYQQNNIYSGGVTIIKGSFYMMEIPLNLRYDFSVAGNTLFFISAGSSSYLMTSENANLYWRHLSRDVCSSVDHLPSHATNLFSTVNLSAGVETGLSNSLSLLVAPYMKLPTKKLGIGQVQMNSVGIDFTFKWSPVTSRKRR